MISRAGTRRRVTMRHPTSEYANPRPATMAPATPRKWRAITKTATGAIAFSTTRGAAYRNIAPRRGKTKGAPSIESPVWPTGP